MQISVYNSFELLNHLRNQWNDLVAESTHPNIFLTWEWVTNWWKWFGKGRELRIIIASEADRIIGILPMWFGRASIIPGYSVPTIALIGDGGPVSPEYLSPIVRGSDVDLIKKPIVETLFSSLGKWRVVRLADVLADDDANKILIEGMGDRFTVDVLDGEPCFYQPLPSDYQSFLNELSKKRRKTIRQTLSKAQRENKVRLECITTKDQVEDYFKIIYGIYDRSLRGQRKIGGWIREDYRGFHLDIARDFAEKNWLRLYVMWFNETPAAFLYCYRYADILWAYQTGFDLSYNNLGPGSIIFQLVIESAINEGIKEFDYLRGDESYKFHFAKGMRPQKRVLFYKSRGLEFKAARSYRKIRNIIHRVKKGVAKNEAPTRNEDDDLSK
jgi:CelD/BcsL family acetyltransferase involved in cellulose biosynthesis